MAKKKSDTVKPAAESTAPAELNGDVATLDETQAFVTANPSPKAPRPWVLRSDAHLYIGRDGIWTAEIGDALRFFTEQDARAYNTLHCAGAYTEAQE